MKCKNCGAYNPSNVFENCGQCRTSPPTVIELHGLVQGVWPSISGDDWCEEFHPSKKYLDYLEETG